MFAKNKIASLRQKSANAIGVFQKALEDLHSVNEELDVEALKKQEAINKLEVQRKELNDQKVANSAFINKLNNFFEVESNVES